MSRGWQGSYRRDASSHVAESRSCAAVPRALTASSLVTSIVRHQGNSRGSGAGFPRNCDSEDFDQSIVSMRQWTDLARPRLTGTDRRAITSLRSDSLTEQFGEHGFRLARLLDGLRFIEVDGIAYLD